MRIQDEIKQLIKRGQLTTSIADRVIIQEKISGYLVYLQEKELAAFAAFKNAYTDRREAESNYVYESNESVSKAKEAASGRCVEYRRSEDKAEIEYENYKLFRQSVQTHLQSMVQHTSSLKWEANNQR